MFDGDPNDPNGDVQKALLAGCLLAVAALVGVIVLIVKAL